MAFAFSANAYEVPKDAVIKVYDSKGTQIGEMKRSEYKVVKLGTSKTKVVTKTVYVNVSKPERNNRVILRGGVGNNGLSVSRNGTENSVTQRDNTTVLGVGYSRKVNERISIGGSYLNNDTATIDVGVDF